MSLLVLKVPMISCDMVSSDFVHKEEKNDEDIVARLMFDVDEQEERKAEEDAEHYIPFYYEHTSYYTFNPNEVLAFYEEEMLLGGFTKKCTYIQYKQSDKYVRLAISPEEFIKMIVPHYSGNYSPITFHKSVLN